MWEEQWRAVASWEYQEISVEATAAEVVEEAAAEDG